jgi:palmitoyl-protein thioesterase
MLKALVFFSAIVSGQARDLTGLKGEEGLTELLQMAEEEPKALAQLIRQSGLAQMAPTFSENAGEATAVSSAASDLPFVLAHGMGDSCFNPGMKSITTAVGKHAGSWLTPAYSTCIATGDDVDSDTNNGFFMDMNKNVDVFAQNVKNNTKLANGFYCIGFSQGNNVCRGYIQKYNDPPVKAHLSVHGPQVGVAGFPSCNPSKNATLAPFCDVFDSLLDLAYTEFFQNRLFQAGYYRDPRKLNTSGFKKYSQIAQWNNRVTRSTPPLRPTSRRQRCL